MDKTIEKLKVFKAVQEINSKNGENIIDVIYYGKIATSKNDSQITSEREEDIYGVKKEVNGKIEFEFKTKDGIIATVNDENKIQINPEYKEYISEKEFLLQVQKPLSLKNLEKKQQQESMQNVSENTQDERSENTPKKHIENPKDAKIDLNKKITLNKTFYDLVPEARKKGVVDVRVRRTENTRFEFIGIDSNGYEVPFETLEQTEGTNPTKEIVNINRDGSEVEKQQKNTILKIKNGENEQRQNEGFTVRLGQYGTPEVSYYRRSPELNEYTEIPVNLENTNQKRTDKEVQQYMEKSKNPTTNDNIKRAEDRIENDDDYKTELENIDDDPYNDTVDSAEIQIQEAAKRCKMSVEAFKKELEKQDGDTLEERIENTENEINEEFIGRGKR